MKKRITLLLILLPLTFFGQANKLFRQALKATDLNQKIALYNQVIELEPENLDAYFYRGIAKNDLGDYYAAIVDYSKIIVAKPDADTYFNRANSRYSLKDLEGAKEDYKKAIEMDPYFVDALYSLACTNFDLGDFELALTNFNKVIKIQPYHQNAYHLRARIYSDLKDHKKALQNYSMAILITPSADSYYNRGVYLMEINYYKKANSDLSKSIRLNGNNGFAYFYRGASQLLLGKFKNSISDFSTALKYDDLDFDAMIGLSIAYYKLNEFNLTKLYLDKAIKILETNNETKKGIDLFENTYWYQNQYYYFYETYEKLKIHITN